MNPDDDAAGVAEPEISPDMIDDEDRFAAVVDAFVYGNLNDRVQRAAILDQEAVVRLILDPPQWQAVLHLQEMTTARFADAIAAVAGWAFQQGRRFPLTDEVEL